MSAAARPSAAARAAVTLGCVMMVAACSIGETRHLTMENPVQQTSEIKTCTGAFAGPDLPTLTACGDGHGHCYDGAKTMLTGLPACSGGSGDTCVPDKILSAKGGKLKSCTFFIEKKPGVCLSMLVKQLADHKDQLQQDVCDDDERCTPCINPQDNTDTHLCDPVGVYEDKCKGGPGAKAETCCHGQGLCLDADAIPEDSRSNMSPDICHSSRLCAPTAMVDGNPEHCNALGLSGVCIDLCFARMLGPAAHVIRAGCGPTSVCLPCIIGAGEGMPGCD